jgi:hypothetical protein
MAQAGGAGVADGLKDAVIADACAVVSVLAKAEQRASEVLARLGHSHSSMARLLEGQAASVAAQLPEMQARPPRLALCPCLCPVPGFLQRDGKGPLFGCAASPCAGGGRLVVNALLFGR